MPYDIEYVACSVKAILKKVYNGVESIALKSSKRPSERRVAFLILTASHPVEEVWRLKLDPDTGTKARISMGAHAIKDTRSMLEDMLQSSQSLERLIRILSAL